MCQVLDTHSLQSPQPWRKMFLYEFNKAGNRGSERQSNLPKATQPVDGRAETQARVCPLPKPVFSFLSKLGLGPGADNAKMWGEGEARGKLQALCRLPATQLSQ